MSIARAGDRPDAPPDLRTLAKRMISAAIAGDFERMSNLLVHADDVADGARFGATIHHLGTPIGGDTVSTECGIRVRGAHVAGAHAASGVALRIVGGRNGVDVHRLHGRAASVVLEFDDGTGCAIPALPGFVALVSLHDGELLDVGFEPLQGNPRWKAFDHRAAEIRALRAVAAASIREGLFRVSGSETLDLELVTQYGKGVDPALALYAGYAFHELQDDGRVQALAAHMRGDIGCTLFDLALLARQPAIRTITSDAAVVPFVPLLSQSWGLLGPLDVSLHPALHGAERCMRDSVWTLFERDGVDMLESAVKSGETR